MYVALQAFPYEIWYKLYKILNGGLDRSVFVSEDFIINFRWKIGLKEIGRNLNYNRLFLHGWISLEITWIQMM